MANNNNGICGVSMRIGGGIVINDIPRENLTSDSFRKSSWPVRFPVSQ